MSKRIKTYLKFQRSERDKTSLVSYVRKEKGSWKGCHENEDYKKKIVLVDASTSLTMLENVLYDVTLVPMKQRDGFVAISAEPVRFPARIDTIIDDSRYAVEVRFGHKLIVYDPASPMDNRRSIDGIIQVLSRRIDIREPERVVSDFKEAAETVLAYYRADHPEP